MVVFWTLAALWLLAIKAHALVSFPIEHVARKSPLRRRDEVLNANLLNVTVVSYLIELKIGTPGQSVKVAIDTGSDELWINPACATVENSSQQQECLNNGIYAPSKSSTVRETDHCNKITYGRGEVDFNYYKDSVAIVGSDLYMTNVIFGVATNTTDLNEGILGLSWGNGTNLGYNNIIDEMFMQNFTESRAFSIALGSIEQDNGGSIIFGGIDKSKFTGPLVTNKMLGPQQNEDINRYWIELTGVGLTPASGSPITYSTTSVPILIDSGSSLSYLPTNIVTRMASDLDAKFDSYADVYVIPCSYAKQKGSVDFTFNGISIHVPFKEFIWQYDKQTCILGAAPSGTGSTLLLGDSFMRAAYTVFDQTTNTISLAQYADCGSNEDDISPHGVGTVTGDCKEAGLSVSNSASGSGSMSDKPGEKVGMAGQASVSVGGLAGAVIAGAAVLLF